MSPLPSGRPNCQKPVQPPAWTLFKLDLSSCENCGGQVRAIASVEDPLVIGKILAHLETRRPMLVGEGCRPEVRGPPPGALELGLLSGGRRACDPAGNHGSTANSSGRSFVQPMLFMALES